MKWDSRKATSDDAGRYSKLPGQPLLSSPEHGVACDLPGRWQERGGFRDGLKKIKLGNVRRLHRDEHDV